VTIRIAIGHFLLVVIYPYVNRRCLNHFACTAVEGLATRLRRKTQKVTPHVNEVSPLTQDFNCCSACDGVLVSKANSRHNITLRQKYMKMLKSTSILPYLSHTDSTWRSYKRYMLRHHHRSYATSVANPASLSCDAAKYQQPCLTTHPCTII